MLSEYPYGAMKVTAVLHALVAVGIIIANAHALYKVNDSFSVIPLIPSEFTALFHLIFAPVIAVGVYILFLGSVGENAGSQKKCKTVVNNFRIFYFVLNILSTFFFSWIGAAVTYLIYISNLGIFGITTNIHATFGLIACELLLSIITIIICCLSGHPGEKPQTESLPLAIIAGNSGINQTAAPPQHHGYMHDPKSMTNAYINNGWGRF